MKWYQSLVESVRYLAQKNPDAAYYSPRGEEEKCLYLSGECGSGQGCLLGQAIARANLPIDLARFDEGNSGVGIQTILCKFDCPHKVGLWCATVQMEQDHGWPWGECVKLADKEYRLRFR